MRRCSRAVAVVASTALVLGVVACDDDSDEAAPPSETDDAPLEEGLHRAFADDGTEIIGRMHGQGPPLVLVHGALVDGETSWDPLLPFLSEQFTVYAMSTRGRGLSGESSDISRERLVEDVTTFVESIGEPVRLMGWSTGGELSLGAASQTDAVSAVAVYEPFVSEVQTEDVESRIDDAFARMEELAAGDRLADAAGAFIEEIGFFNDAEVAVATDPGVLETLAPNVRVQIQEEEQRDEGSSLTDPSALAEITAPVLLLAGTETVAFYIDGLRHVAEHVADPEIREVAGAGHLGPLLAPEVLAEELVQFFEAVQPPA